MPPPTESDRRSFESPSGMRPSSFSRTTTRPMRRGCRNAFSISCLLAGSRRASRRTSRMASPALAISLALGSPLVAQAPQPDGAGLERGTLLTTWAETGDACASTVDFKLHEYNADFYILRQSGCTNYEKPFLYLIFGADKALLLDSGAKGADVATAIRAALARWASAHGRSAPLALIVAHSHGHGDHIAGDSALAALPNTTVVGTAPAAVQQFFGFHNWPLDSATFDLGGGRVLDIVPIPGHQPASIAVYDRRTGVL